MYYQLLPSSSSTAADTAAAADEGSSSSSGSSLVRIIQERQDYLKQCLYRELLPLDQMPADSVEIAREEQSVGSEEAGGSFVAVLAAPAGSPLAAAAAVQQVKV